MSEFGGYPVPPETEANLLKFAAGTIHTQSNEIDRLTARCKALRAAGEAYFKALDEARAAQIRGGSMALDSGPLQGLNETEAALRSQLRDGEKQT